MRTDFRHGAEKALKNRRPNEVNEKISLILIKVGIVPNVKGYGYLRDAVLIAMDNTDIRKSFTVAKTLRMSYRKNSKFLKGNFEGGSAVGRKR